MHPLISKLFGKKPPPDRVGSDPAPDRVGRRALVRRARGELRMVGPFDLGPGWANGRHPGSKRPLAARTAERRRRNKAARAARKRNRS